MDLASRRLFELAAGLAAERSLDRLLERVLDAVMEVSLAERGFIVLLEDGEPRVRKARPVGKEARFSWTILGRVLAEDRPIVLADALGDPDFRAARSVQRERVRSVCALPLRTSREAIGAIYLDHRAEANAFGPGLLTTLHAFAGLAALAIQGAPRPEPVLADEPPDGFVAVDPKMKRAVQLVRRFAGLPYPVYIHGESGTGKELVARAVHESGPRRAGPFVAANCAAITGSVAESELFGHVRGAFTGADRDRAGLFEQANGGTLFLDEVEAMPAAVQEKLLRVLQDGEVRRVGAGAVVRVDARVLSASNEDIALMEGRFRRDLFYRLNVLRIDLPPLRERPADLPALAGHFLAAVARETGAPRRSLSREALDRLARHRWPGNVRELESAVRRACVESASDPLAPEDFAFLDCAPRGLPSGVEPVAMEDHLRRTVEQFGRRLTMEELAQRLGISRKTLWKRKREWGMK